MVPSIYSLAAAHPPLRLHSGHGPLRQRSRSIDAISVRERPAEVEDRAIPGRLGRGDLLRGTRSKPVTTLVEAVIRASVCW